MQIEILTDEESAARVAAKTIAVEARIAVAARNCFVMAVSGGRTPWIMMRALGNEDMPWDRVHVVQVDERVAPAGDPDNSLTHLQETLLSHTPIRAEQVRADRALSVDSADVALTGVYQGRRRLTLTYAVINRSRRLLWLVTGGEKAGILARLDKGDPSISAGRICRRRALIISDRAAARDVSA